MIRELTTLAVVSTVDQIHPLFSFSENSIFKAGRNLGWYVFTAVLADGLLTDEAPQVSAWVPALLAASFSTGASPGVAQALAARRAGPFGWFRLEGQGGGSLSITPGNRTSSSHQGSQDLSLGG